MSDLFVSGFGREVAAMAPMPLYGPSSGFRGDARYCGTAAVPASAPDEPPDDPLERAFTEGFAAGAEQARAEAEALAKAESEARDALSLGFTRLSHELAEQLRQRLRDTVAALCETALDPMVLDKEALLRRIDQALALFARADDERVIRLNPDDLALVSPQLAKDWQVVPDPSLVRGALRIEAANGGVEDGPAQWRAAIAEAFEQ